MIKQYTNYVALPELNEEEATLVGHLLSIVTDVKQLYNHEDKKVHVWFDDYNLSKINGINLCTYLPEFDPAVTGTLPEIIQWLATNTRCLPYRTDTRVTVQELLARSNHEYQL
jgi:hypothetical protein